MILLAKSWFTKSWNSEEFCDWFAGFDDGDRALLSVSNERVVVEADDAVEAGEEIAGAERAVFGFGSVGIIENNSISGNQYLYYWGVRNGE